MKRTDKQARAQRKRAKRTAVVFYPLTVGFYADCPHGRVALERRGLTRQDIDAFWVEAEKVLKRAGLLQVFERSRRDVFGRTHRRRRKARAHE